MTASWKLQSSLADGSEVEMTFSTRNIRPLVSYVVSVRSETDSSRRKFRSQRDAEEWAQNRGVTRWSTCECHRAYPYAELIPIAFSDAPPPKTLDDLIEKLNAGVTVAQLVDLVNAGEYDMKLKVSPIQLRMWMIGHAPLSNAVAKLKNKRKRRG